MYEIDVKSTRVEYKSVDGTPLVGIISMPSETKGFVLMMHGITVDKDEWENFYVDLADELHREGLGTLRFDFRGHGESGGSSMDVSIMGNVLDIKASIEQIKKHWCGKIIFIATSFGAGPAIITASEIQDVVQCLVLIAPVIDYDATFLNPRTEWAKESFNESAFEELQKKGYLILDESFKLSANLIEEFRTTKPYEILDTLKIPVLSIHGEKDSMVPFEITKKHAQPNPESKFFPLPNADHGYPDYDDETGKGPKSQENKKKIFNEINHFIAGGV